MPPRDDPEFVSNSFVSCNSYSPSCLPAGHVDFNPPPIDLRITGLDMSPWRGARTQVEGTMGAAGTPREFKANTARSVFGTCPNN